MRELLDSAAFHFHVSSFHVSRRMGIIDFILNLAGLLLWLNWRSLRFDPLGKRTPATLIGTLRRAEPRRLRRWHLPAALGGLLLLRAVFYWQIGSGVGLGGGKTGSGRHRTLVPQRFLRAHSVVFLFQFRADAGSVLSLAVVVFHFGRAGTVSSPGANATGPGGSLAALAETLPAAGADGAVVVAGQLGVGVAGHRAPAGFGSASH